MKKPTLWIAHIAYEAATGRLCRLYDRIEGPGDNVDNIMLDHSLNRTVPGLGLSVEGDILGLSPSGSDDPGDWSHH